MAKFVKKKYYNANGDAKVNNYLIYISKEIVKEAGLTGEENLKIYAKDKKIIIEKGE